MEGTSTDRFNFRLNADSKFIDIITLGLNVSGNHEEVEEPTIGTYYVFEQMKWHSRPSVPYKYSNGEWGFVDGNDKMQAIKNPAYATTITSKKKYSRFDVVLLENLHPAAQTYCQPEVNCTVQTFFRRKERSVLVVQIEESLQKTRISKDETEKLVRLLHIKDENILATPVHLRVWQQSGSPRGELITYTEREQLLLDLLEENDSLSLNRYCR